MANFAQNDISPLIFFFFWQQVYYLLDATEKSCPGISKEMRARWVGAGENIGTMMCWKLVDDVSGKIICRSTIHSAIEPGTANLQVDPLEPIPDPVEPTNQPLDNFMSLVDFDTPLSHTTKLGPVDSIPVNTKPKTWQDIK